MVYVRLYFEAPPGTVYTGAGFESVTDKMVYYSMIEQGRAGRLLMKNLHTSEPQRGMLFSPHWLLIGATAGALNMPGPLAYHIYRALFEVVFLCILVAFIRKLFEQPAHQLGALAAVLFASGLGWIYYIANPGIGDPALRTTLFNSIPADLYVTELHTFSAMVQSPLFIIAFILIVHLFYFFARHRSQSAWWVDAVLAGEACLLVLIHPYDAVLIAAVTMGIAVWHVAMTRSSVVVRHAAAVVMGIALAAAYHFAVLRLEPSLAGWLSQNLTYSPAFGSYLWALGILVPLALVGTYRVFRQPDTFRSIWWQIVVVWALTVPIIMYLPLHVNRRFTTAWSVPVALLSYVALAYILGSLKRYYLQTIFVVVVILTGCTGTLYLCAQYAVYAPVENGESHGYYLRPYMVSTFNAIQSSVGPSDVLLSNEKLLAILLDAYVPVTLYIGHTHQTANYPLKRQQAEWFFAPSETDTAVKRKKEFLADAGITHILLYKPSMVTDYQWLLNVDFVRSVFSNEAFEFFEVAITN